MCVPVWMTMCCVFSFTSLQMGRKEVDYIWGDRGTMWAMTHSVEPQKPFKKKKPRQHGTVFIVFLFFWIHRIDVKKIFLWFMTKIHFVTFFRIQSEPVRPENAILQLFLVCVARQHVFSVRVWADLMHVTATEKGPQEMSAFLSWRRVKDIIFRVTNGFRGFIVFGN